MNLEQTFARLLEVRAEIAQLEEQEAALKDALTSALPEGDSVEVGGMVARTYTRTTFKSADALALLKRKRNLSVPLEKLFDEPKLNGSKVKSFYPDVYERASVVSAPFLRVTEAKE